MPSSVCKTRPISADPSRFPSTRASISQHVSSFTNDGCNSLLDTSSKFFITSTQQGFYPSSNQPTPGKTSTSFSRTIRSAQSPRKRPMTAQKEEESIGLNLSMALLEVKDEKGNPLVRPMRRLQTDKFQTFLYKFKQEKDELEQKINKLHALELALKGSKLRSTAKCRIAQSLLEKSMRRKAPDPHNSTFNESMDISEDNSPIKVFKHTIISSALSTATPTPSTRAKSAGTTEKTPKRPNSSLGMSSNRPHKMSPAIDSPVKDQEQSQPIIKEKFVRYSAAQNSVELSRIVENPKQLSELETVPSKLLTESGNYFFSRASRETGDIERERMLQQHLNNSLPVPGPKAHTLMISLNTIPTPDKYMRSRYYHESEKVATIHSKKTGSQARVRKPGTGSVRSSIEDSEVMQEWFDDLTIQGSTVEPKFESAVYLNAHNPVAVVKRNLWSAKIQRRKEKAAGKEEEKSVVSSQVKQGDNSVNKAVEENNGGSEVTKQAGRTVEWTFQRGKVRRKTEGVSRVTEEEAGQEKESQKEKEKEKEKDKKRSRGMSLLMEDTVKVRVEGWDVINTVENIDRGIENIENIDKQTLEGEGELI